MNFMQIDDRQRLLIATWKNGQAGYCARLVATRGNSMVPAPDVAQYLETQLRQAMLQKIPVIPECLKLAIAAIKTRDWKKAEIAAAPLKVISERR